MKQESSKRLCWQTAIIFYTSVVCLSAVYSQTPTSPPASDAAAQEASATGSQQPSTGQPPASSRTSWTQSDWDTHIANIADKTIAQVERQTTFLAVLWTILAVGASIGGLLLARYEIQTVKPLREARENLEREIKNLKDEHQRLVETKVRLLEETTRNHKVLMQTVKAQITLELKDLSESKNRKDLEKTSRNLSDAIDLNQPTDNGIAAWAYNVDAYLKYLLEQLSDAYRSARESVKNQPQNNDLGYYNLACFAAQLRLFDECVAALKEAIQTDASNRNDAKSEKDFDPIRSYPPFATLIS